MPYRFRLNWQLKMRRFCYTTGLIVVWLLLVVPVASADDPDSKSGVQPQVISLPSGPGSIDGIGESFEPDLSTGTASYPFNFVVPPGRVGMQPSLTLNYNGGNGNGPWGIGWKLNVPSIQRYTDEGLPSYDDAQDRFIYSSGEKLVRLNNGDYRFENEGSFMRFRRLAGGGWEAHTPDGSRYLFGQSASAQVTNQYGIFRWHLEQQLDPNGNEVQYFYTQAGSYAYLSEIRYNASSDGRYNAITFAYESRPDIFTDRTSRAPITIARRVSRLDMQALGQPVRSYQFGYKPESSTSTHSLLVTITPLGADSSSALPPHTFDYTPFEPDLYAVVSMENPPPVSLTNADADLVDISYDGLPDVVYTPDTGHRFYLNQGQGRWQTSPTLPKSSPPDRLSSPSVHMADMDSNGQVDLLVKAGVTPGSPFYYYAGRPAQEWEQTDRIDYNLSPAFSLNDPDLRLVDMNHDKRIDVFLTTNTRYFIFLARPDNTWPDTADVSVPSQSVGTPLIFSDPHVKLADMTGDKLQDLVYARDGLVVYFPHNGLGDFAEGVSMTGAPTGLGPQDERLNLADVNGDGLDDLILAGNRSVQYWLNLGNNSFGPVTSLSNTPAYDQVQVATRLADMDGDGASELLFSRYPAPEAEVLQYVDFFTGSKPLLLNTINNGLGRTIEIAYQPQTHFYVEDWQQNNPWQTTLPFPVDVVSRVTVKDANSGDSYITEFRYRDGYYDGEQKEFRGFAQVTKTDVGDDTAPTSVTEYVYDTGAQDESRKGLMLKMTVLGENGQCSDTFSDCYRRQVNQVETRTLVQVDAANRVAYSFINQSDTLLYEQQASPVQLRQTYDQDNYGNVIEHFNYGQICGSDLTCGNDEVLTRTQYVLNESAWIINKPAVINVTDAGGGFVRQTRHYYDGEAYQGLPLKQVERGNLARTEANLGPEGNNRWVQTQRRAFDSFGNAIGLMDPNGHVTTVTYDPLVHTFPVVEQLPIDSDTTLTFAASYHYGFGQVASATDFNGNVSTYFYDTFGRLSKIVLPGDSPAQPTQQFSYVLGSPVSQIVTEQREQSGTNQVLRSVAFFDGLGRQLQSRREAESGQVIVEEATTFNARQSQRDQFLPYFANDFNYQPPDQSQPHTTRFYDPTGRVIRTENPDSSISRVDYQTLTEIQFDEEDNRAGSPYANTPKTLEYDGLNRLVTVTEVNRVNDALENYVTRYRYDPLGNLTRITDAQNNIKTMRYDALSRKLFMADPNRGQMRYRYDDVGNLLETEDAKGQVVRYRYDAANRPLKEQWLLPGGSAQDHVVYHYDDELWPFHRDAQNTMGQLTYIEDEAGQVFFSYDARGNVTGQIRRFEAEGLEFTTRMAYDAMDRLSRLTYPDGREISYTYNAQGLLEGIPGFIDDIDYTAADQRDGVSYPNGVNSSYGYDIRLRMERLVSQNGQTTLQDLSYTFDQASNIMAIADGRPDRTPQNDQSHSYQYDALYRLTGAEGAYGRINYAYDSLGNMTFKNSTTADARLNLGQMRYGENGAGPHALTSTDTETRSYDANGNLSRKNETEHQWDYRDRLTLVSDGVLTSTYSYDANGQRTRQIVQQGDTVTKTLYLGQYAEIQDDRLVSYIFDDTRRVAQITTDLDISTLIRGFSGATASPTAQAEVRWYLSDHLGSTSLQVDEASQIVSEVGYYPYGLTRYEQNGDTVRYRFTGKELDATGLQYFEARYYDAGTGRFISTDPLYEENPISDFAYPQTLNLYAYVLNNPIKNIDTKGMQSTPAPSVRWVGSPNSSARPDPTNIRAIIIHATGGTSINNTIRRFNNPDSGVSAHYTIGKSGEIVQHVRDQDKAWHAGNSKLGNEIGVNRFSLGIELVNRNNGQDPYTSEQYNSLVDLVASLVDKYDIPLGKIVGHHDVAPGRKTDPQGLDLTQLRGDVGNSFWTTNGQNPGLNDAGSNNIER